MSHSHVNAIMKEKLPQDPSLSFSFSPRLFVCFCHRDVTVVLTAPPLLNVYKAEVGQIWLKDIQFCSYFTWVKIKPEGVWEEPSLLAINMYQLPTIPGHDASYFAHFSFFLFFVLSLPLLLNQGRLNPCAKNSRLGALMIICQAPTAFKSKQR